MGLLDSIIGKSFRNEKAGRVVVFTGDRRHRGYVLKSESDEPKIRSFLRMFYFAHFCILLMGMMLANAWSTFFTNLHEFGSPTGHILRACGIYLGIYSVVVGIPYFFLWRSYKKAQLNFVSVEDEVLVSGKNEGRFPWLALAGLTLLLLAGLMLFVRWSAKS